MTLLVEKIFILGLFLFLGGLLLSFAFLCSLYALEVVVVVAEVFLHSVLCKNENPVGELVNEISVVADYEQSAAVFGERFFKLLA